MPESEAQLVSVLGAECTGKSTLCPALAAFEGGRWIPEYVREFFDVNARPPSQHEQHHVVAEQIRREQLARRLPGRVFVDSSPLMTAIYSIHYFGDHALLESALAHQRRSYAATLVCDTDLPWVADGLIRDSPAVRARCQALLLEQLQRGALDFTLVSGALPARLVTARARLARLDPISSAAR